MIALYAAVGALALGGFIGWQTRGWKADADDRDRIELIATDLREQAAGQRRASDGLRTDLAAIAGRGLKLQGEVHADLSLPTRDCPKVAGDAVVPGSLGRLLNDIDGHDAASAAR